MSTPTTDAFLASTSFIMHANLLLAQVQGLDGEAPCNKVEGIMRLWQKWCTMRGGRIMWERNGELLEWCMARYCDNLGAEWLALFANNSVPVAPSFDEELEALLAEEEPLVVSTATKGKEAVIALLVEQDLRWQEEFWQEVAKESEADAHLEALVHKGLGLGEATEAGKGSRQGQEEEEEEEEGAKEKTPDTIAGAAMGVAMLAARKVPMGGAKGLALPAKKGSPTKPASKCRGCPMPRYKQDFSDKELARLLTPRWAEVVVDTGVEAGVVLKETKGKATMDLAMHQAFKEERRACNKCWVDDNSEGCWYPIGAPLCFECVAMKRPCILEGPRPRSAAMPLTPRGEDLPPGSAGEKGVGSGGEGKGGRGLRRGCRPQQEEFSTADAPRR
ncbi:hypothetical protein C0993_007636 [Termitomyces sp. T159_Od127]|nr:hypothetical protein C0993_007636 [Termitomyces sp. T159_Od127]